MILAYLFFEYCLLRFCTSFSFLYKIWTYLFRIAIQFFLEFTLLERRHLNRSCPVKSTIQMIFDAQCIGTYEYSHNSPWTRVVLFINIISILIKICLLLSFTCETFELIYSLICYKSRKKKAIIFVFLFTFFYLICTYLHTVVVKIIDIEHLCFFH